MVGQGHRSDQHDFDPTPGGSGRQEGLACSGPLGHEELDTQRLNNNTNTSSGLQFGSAGQGRRVWDAGG